MKWLEVIELRTVYKDIDKLKIELEKLISDIGNEFNFQNIKMYRHLLVETDFIINLFHDEEKISAGGSSLGFQITSALKEFGLVNHKILIELSDTDDQHNSSSEE